MFTARYEPSILQCEFHFQGAYGIKYNKHSHTCSFVRLGPESAGNALLATSLAHLFVHFEISVYLLIPFFNTFHTAVLDKSAYLMQPSNTTNAEF